MINHKLYYIILFCYIIVIIYLVIGFNNVSANEITHPHRVRRYLGFRNISRFFFRVNWKNNMVRWNQFFAEALGFKLSYDDPPDSFYPHRHLRRRDVYSHLEMLLDKNGLNGLHCIRRGICELGAISEPQGIYHRILKIVFRRLSSETARWHDLAGEDCLSSTNQCPFSMLDVSMYTDI